jgi:hypothetical protein
VPVCLRVGCPRIRVKQCSCLSRLNAGWRHTKRARLVKQFSSSNRHVPGAWRDSRGKRWWVFLRTHDRGSARVDQHSKLDRKRSEQARARLASDRICGGGAGCLSCCSLHGAATSRRLLRWGAVGRMTTWWQKQRGKVFEMDAMRCDAMASCMRCNEADDS